ncbi:DUF5994 family protein [Amycolatopsis minnesotensis]|uniref:Uncharacterized protein n=1 Tax=Amycolatopsis minnesotensis TaxID=337894 RepID=A0ABP5CQL3_9PSEU
MAPDPRVQPGITTWPPSPASTHHRLRLRLKPKDAPPGGLDGAWWPRSRELRAELPALVEVLAIRLGYIAKVVYVRGEWENVPRRAEIDGHIVLLDASRAHDENLVVVTGPEPHRVRLLVIPPDTTAECGHAALMAASRRDNADRPGDLLAANDVLVPGRDDAQDTWDTEGGRLDRRW